MKKNDLYQAAQAINPGPHLKARLAAVVTRVPERRRLRRPGMTLAACMLFALAGVSALWLNGYINAAPSGGPGDLSPGAGAAEPPDGITGEIAPSPDFKDISIIYDADLQRMYSKNPDVDVSIIDLVHGAFNRRNAFYDPISREETLRSVTVLVRQIFGHDNFSVSINPQYWGTMGYEQHGE